MLNSLMDKHFDRKSTIILWVETFFFAMIYGLIFKSWLVGGIIFLVSAVFLSRPKTTVYTILILSLLWSFIFASIGYGFGGVIGAIVLGGLVFLNGVKLHFRDLKQQIDSPQDNKAIDWRQNWYLGRQNLN